MKTKAKTGLIILIIIIIAVVIGGIYLFTTMTNTTSNPPANNPAETPQANSVEIKSFAFSPLTLTVKKGDTVTWTNQDSASHTVTSDSGSELNSETLSKGQTYSHTFNTAGTYTYYCSIHPSMKATIVVE